MAVVSLVAPFPIFTDQAGQPLDDGYIYVGVAGSGDPAGSPISIFYDAALTQPAENPIRTSGGYPVNTSGNPTNVYASSNFSILVKNSRGVQTLYLANYGVQILAENISFDTLGIGLGILPTAAGGAVAGNTLLPWSSVVTRILFAKSISVFDQTQPAAAADLAVLNQLMMPLAACGQTANTPGTFTLENIKNVASGASPGTGIYNCTTTVAIPSDSLCIATSRSNTACRTAHALITGANTVQVRLRDETGALVDGSFSLVVFGNPGVANPIS